jgi:hypothetical protein
MSTSALPAAASQDLPQRPRCITRDLSLPKPMSSLINGLYMAAEAIQDLKI